MFDFNELRFIDDLIVDYLERHPKLDMRVRNRILKLDNKVLEYKHEIQKEKMQEIQADSKYIKRISF